MILLKAISILIISMFSFSWWVNEEHRPKIYFFFEPKEDALQRENDPILMFTLNVVINLMISWATLIVAYLTIQYFWNRVRVSYPLGSL